MEVGAGYEASSGNLPGVLLMSRLAKGQRTPQSSSSISTKDMEGNTGRDKIEFSVGRLLHGLQLSLAPFMDVCA